MSFGKYVFSVGFNQKTVKDDLFIKANHVYPQQNYCEKTLEHSGWQLTKANPEGLTCGAGQPHLQADRPMGPIHLSLLRMLVIHHV